MTVTIAFFSRELHKKYPEYTEIYVDRRSGVEKPVNFVGCEGSDGMPCEHNYSNPWQPPKPESFLIVGSITEYMWQPKVAQDRNAPRKTMTRDNFKPKPQPLPMTRPTPTLLAIGCFIGLTGPI